MWDQTKCHLSVSHGQAAVEHEHPVNKDMLVENLKVRSLIASRLQRTLFHTAKEQR